MLTGWKKTVLCLVITALLFHIGTFTVLAEGGGGTKANRYGLQSKGELPSEVGKLLDGSEDGDPTAAANELDTGYFLGIIADAVNFCFGGVLKNTALMLGAVVMSALVRVYSRGDGLSSALGRTAGLVSVMCLGLTYYSVAKIAWDSVKGAVSAMTLIMSGLLPGVVASCAASGEVTLSAVTSTGITLLLALFERLCSDALLPLLNVCFALSLANGLSGSDAVDLTGISRFVKNTFAVLMGILMAVFCVSAIFRTNLARSADSVLLRSVRFASGSFVPIVGGALSEASGAVLGGLRAIRANAGTAASVAVVAAAVPKLSELLLYRLAFGFCAGSARLLGSVEDGGFISELGAVLTSGIVIVLCCGVMLLLSLAMVSGG